ncbi:MAG: F0F1 ATP synthase subunit B [Xanthomonadales bacterium]|nr:F0F1 ATP synthase subunit B [Xanthomonadales bacterium]MCB1628880.1 F0F1 ATP synthase subunit B [Xanthomonadales bacterium]
MNINLTLVIQGLAFFATAWLVMKFGWPHIIGAIEARQKKIAEGLAAADAGQKALEEAKSREADVLKEARSKANEIHERAHQQYNQIVDQAKRDAEAEKARQLAAAEAEVANLTAKVKDQLRGQVAVLAVAGAEKLIRKEIDPQVHKQLLDELIAEI